MFAPELYFPIYLAIAYTLVIVKIFPMNDVLRIEPDNRGLIKAGIVGGIFIIIFGFRPSYYEEFLYMADTSGYAAFYNDIVGSSDAIWTLLLNDDGSFDWDSEFIFGGIRNLMAWGNLSVELWFTVVAAIFIIPKVLVSKYLFPGREYLAFLFFVTALGFYSGGTNGIRNADGSSVFLIGLTLICCNKPKKLLGTILCICSYYFHHSEIILIISLLLAVFVVKKTNYAITLWVLAIVITLAVGNTLAAILGPYFEDKRVDTYILSDQTEGFRKGFRWDFIIFSAAPILMGWYATVRQGIKDKAYQLILNTYIIANAIWIIFMYASYTNRFAALSWALYPIALCYPLLNLNIFGISTPKKTCLILIFQLIMVSLI